MRKLSLLLTVLVLAVMVLAACGGEEATGTAVVESLPPVTVDATEGIAGTATEMPAEGTATEEGVTETPGVPVTGGVNPARLSNQLDFTVWSQDGEQIGDVEDMVLIMDDPQIAYVVVGTGGFLDLGEKQVLVPWDSLALQTGAGDATGGQENAFILQTDVDTFSNAPDFDLETLPAMAEPAADWDVAIRTYWESGGAAGTVDTPAAETPVVDATPTVDAGAGQAGPATELQGVMLASDVLGSTITVTGQGNVGEGQPTATPDTGGAGTGQATTTPGVGVAPGDPGLGTMDVTIEDMIVDTDTGDILYIVVNALLDEGERWIPVPLDRVQWNADSQLFVLDANPADLREAPSFEEDQFPDITVPDWDDEFEAFWQNLTNP